MKTAIISGAFGQDAKYLSDLLLARGLQVVLVYRYSSIPLEQRAQYYNLAHENVKLECLDIADPTGVNRVVDRYQPDYIYNLAAQSHVGQSFADPFSAISINCCGVLNWLEAIKTRSPETRFLQASTSEMWGSNFSVDGSIKYQDENTPFSPNSPYAVGKLAAHNLVKIYRDSYGLFACTSICHNHESPIRGENFVTRKITRWIGQHLKKLTKEKLQLGNIEAVRDWSHASDIVMGMERIINHSEPRDFVLCSGQGRSVKEFLHQAIEYAELTFPPEYYYEINPKFYRPCEVEYLQGRADLAREVLGWAPVISFEELVEEMVNHDCQ